MVSPQNSGSGKLTGVEGGVSCFPRFPDGFGANGTRTAGVNRAGPPLSGRTGCIEIPLGNGSNRSATATLIHERSGRSTCESCV